jgi:hypothetical protein
MRRLGLILPALAAVILLAGCSGADAGRAEELLRQSDQALKALHSYRFAGRLTLESDGVELTFVMKGGGNKRGGASYLTMHGEGVPGFPELTLVQQGGTLWLRQGGSWTRMQAPAGQPNGLEQFDLGAYVEDVRVEEGASVGGEPAVKLSGVIDSGGVLRAVLGGLDDALTAGVSLDEVEDALGDVHVVLYVSEVSHLPVRTLVDMTIEAEGHRADLRFDFALEPAKRPVRIPIPTA